MSYLGRVEFKSADIKLKASTTISGSSTNTVVLTWTAPNEQSIMLKVNGVVQHTDAYSIAGSPTTITLASGNFADGATVEVVGINNVGSPIVPADGSVTALKLADDSVTAAKLDTTGTPTGAKFLQDDMAWTTVDSLPSQTSQSGKFLTTDGSTASWGTVASSGFIGYTVYTSGDTWTKTDNNPTKLVVEVQGAGGSGGGGGASKGAGGGAGGYARKFLDVTNIDTCTIEVGTGGLNPTTNSAGNVGGASKFYKASGSGTFTSIDGLGGSGGAANYGSGGAGGVASGGDLNITGGSGGGNTNENNFGGGSFFTPFHYSITGSLNPSGPGSGYGGGGEGSRVTGAGAGSKGGDGMDGVVIVWEYK